MKTFALSIAISISIIGSSSGEIKNGYETIIAEARRELIAFNQLFADGTLSPRQKQELKTKLRTIKNIIEYYEVTEQLLQLFKTISPDLYYPIDTIKDCKGRWVDVYIRFLPVEDMEIGFGATTNVQQSENDEDGYFSKYGPNTVGVKIVAAKHSLVLLAHEFGHIAYQVPNLRSYHKFYFRHYQRISPDSKEIGHHPDDLSGQMAYLFEHRFRQQYFTFLMDRNSRMQVN